MKDLKIEILYPEFNNLFGDRGNYEYLSKKLKSADCNIQLFETSLYEKPAFASQDIDILLIGPCTESAQILQLEELKKYKGEISARIDSEKVTLATGNAFELFGQYIERADGSKIECLQFFGHYAKQFSRLRFNDNAVGTFENMKIVGFKNLLSHSYGELEYPFLKMMNGSGMNPDTDIEGIHKNNFFSTYHTGPILPLNPEFCDYLIRLCDEEYIPHELEFEKKAYEKRLEELT